MIIEYLLIGMIESNNIYKMVSIKPYSTPLSCIQKAITENSKDGRIFSVCMPVIKSEKRDFQTE